MNLQGLARIPADLSGLRCAGDRTPGTANGTCASLLNAGQRDLLERGLRQRFEAVNACLDVIVRERNVPEFLKTCGFIQSKIQAVLGPIMGSERSDVAWAWLGSADVQITRDGQLTVFDHNFSLPTGLDLLPDVNNSPGGVVHPFPALPENDGPAGVAVLLVPGFHGSAVRENEFLAKTLMARQARSTDLSVRDDGVFLKAGSVELRVSTIIRRIEDSQLDPNCFRPDSLVGLPGLIRAWRKGLVNVVSPPGTCLANCRTFGKLIPRMIREFLAERPILKSATVLECGDPAVLKRVLSNVTDYAIRTNDPAHPGRPFFGRTATAVEFSDLLQRLRKNPAAYVARPLLPETTDGGLNLRFFATMGGPFRLHPVAIGRRCQPDGGAGVAVRNSEEIVAVD